MMSALLRRSRCEQDPRFRFALRNEYYWQTRQRAKQFQLGVAQNRLFPGLGWYSQGVGAAWRAYELAAAGQRRRAGSWARRSLTAWKRFAARDPDYYNQFVHKALAEGVLGRRSAMRGSLARGIQLSRGKLAQIEFSKIADMISVLNRRCRNDG